MKELYRKLASAVVAMKADEVRLLSQQALERGYPPEEAIQLGLAALVTGSEALLIGLVKTPREIRQLLDVCCENQLQLVEAICAEGYIPLIGAPISSGSLIGPQWFREFAQPYLERLFCQVKASEQFNCMHICGEVSPLVGRLPLLNLDLLSFEEWCKPLWDRMPETIPMGYVPTDLFARGCEETVENSTENA
ncbi:MAG TPA: hypothetical protein ENL08_06275 [Bacteroidetes bacterium]|nr:hypothetical protein [Bacteroidota bacterium]